MKINLISSICSDLGLCTIAPLLKKEGHEVKLLFIPALLRDYSRPLSNKVVNNIKEFINGADIVGINGLSENYFKTAILADDIKKALNVPLVWGGIHATLKPGDCIKHADIVCVGEGEQAMLELVRKLERKESLENIKNLLMRSNASNVKKVELREPVDLDSLPLLDCDLDFQYIAENNKIRKMEESDFNGAFYSYTSRGCPFRCSYCCNDVILNMYGAYKFCRQRSIGNTIEELKLVKRHFPSCKIVWFNEADFLSGKSQKEIENFSKRYKAEIDIPFSIWSYPSAVTDENIRMLKWAGLRGINIGTVNGNERIQRGIYNRNAPGDLYISRARILKKYGIKTEYDVILCNPRENDDEIINTIELLMRLPKPCKIVIHYLTYFMGTELHKMALKNGMVDENEKYTQSYTKAAYKVWRFRGNSTYLNIMLSMMRGWSRRIGFLGIDCYGVFLPGPILRFLIKKPVVKFFKNLPMRSLICNGIANLIMVGNVAAEKISNRKRQLLFFLKRKFRF